ncbi:MAG: choice-of-anchor J domain-containing protein [Bacteroidales bacterium]|nr:choice-of-anchor J domain-containing protein [Bacteroidales bacterium]
MKNRIIYALAAVALATASCDDYNDNFEGLDEMVKNASKDVKKVEMTLESSNYKNGSFFASTDDANATIIPLLTKQYPTADNSSAVKVTYNVATERPEYLSKISAAKAYTVSDDDYASVWKSAGNNFFTPAKKAADNIPNLLLANFASAANGDRVLVTYNYSPTEPAEEQQVGGTGYSTDFEDGFDDWTEKQVQGSFNWAQKTFNDNAYIQFSANKAEGVEENWIVSPKIDITGCKSPKFSFSACTGYYNAACLSVLISTDYNGTDIASATWTDVTANFAFELSKKYGTMQLAGVIDMADFVSDNLYIAFKYLGDGTNAKTTTYQIDDVCVGDNVAYSPKVLFAEDFTTNNTLDALKTAGWTNLEAEKNWQVKTYNDNNYLQMSAYGATGENVASMITPAIDIPANGTTVLQFSINGAYFTEDCLEIAVLLNDGSGKTTDVTKCFFIPQNAKYAPDYVLSGSALLSEFAGANVFIAFKYNGSDTKTTTYQIDDVKVITYTAGSNKTLKAAAKDNTEQHFALYQYNGTKWIESTDAIVVNPGDYNAMGSKYSNFSATFKAEDYLGKFAASKLPYAVEGQKTAIVYNFYDSTTKATTIAADEYTFANGEWNLSANYEQTNGQFVKTNGNWIFDPSVVLNFPRDGDATVDFFQKCTDWVWDNIDTKLLGCTTKGQGYVTSYANNEYYSGCSAYQKDVDWRPAKARDQYAAGFSGNDTEDLKLMQQHLIDVLQGVLCQEYADAKTMDGVDITYTINFVAYDGVNHNYTIVFKLVDNGKFEYVKDSLSEI